MKYLLIILTGILFFGCKRQSYQNQDIKYMSGTWNIVKVTSDNDQNTSIYENWGTFTINEDGTGSLDVKSVDYTATGEPVKCIFTVVPIKGIDYTFTIYGLKKVDANGKATNYLCDDGKLRFWIEKQKRKKMTLKLEQTLANLTPCDIMGYNLNKGDILWFMEKQ
ncbi:MAG: hypothetical protein Q8M29_04230 [Bacteroidota bacterium]|nr:hypothetical protein [Bacteroidota bacterium]